MYRVALYEAGVCVPVGDFITLPSLPVRDTWIEYEGRTWRVTDVIIYPHTPGSRQCGTDAPVLAEVIVMPGHPVWRPDGTEPRSGGVVTVVDSLEEFKERTLGTTRAPVGMVIYDKSTKQIYVRTALYGENQWVAARGEAPDDD